MAEIKKRNKRVSAFSVFKTKKDKGDKSQIEDCSSVPLTKASSMPAINEEKIPNKLLKALKGGSLRGTMRGQKHRRSSILTDGPGNSPFIAGDTDGITLTGLKPKKGSVKPTTCCVCGAKAASINYGVLTCHTCAVLFRRDTLEGKSATFVCHRGQACTADSIRQCKYCRFQKFTAVGMKLLDHATKSTKSPVTPINVENLPPPGSTTQIEETPKTGRKWTTEDISEGNQAMRSKKAPPPPPTINGDTTKTVSPKASKRQRKPLPPLPQVDVDSVKQEVTQGTKRGADSSTSSLSKKKRVTSPTTQKPSPSVSLPVQPVRPMKQDSDGKTLEYMYNSSEEARKMFECMIHPVQVDKFFNELWQKKPLLVRRHIATYNDGWFSTAELDRILREHHIEFGTNIDVTSYRDGKRETHNPEGRVYPPVLWDAYQNGCSIRLLNPQTYSHNVWKMLSTMQEFFSCCVGTNVYLTPPGTQGFAPHYDDIEAFILQLEGKKHWRLYNPRNDEETLPRTSSINFDEAEIGEPILDVVLHAGDLLYFPRGVIHQGRCLEDAHSLHITVSCYQKNTWGDLLEKLVPRAVQVAMEEDVEFRQGLPTDYLHYMGLVHSDMEDPRRHEFMQKMMGLMTKMIENYSPVDVACDQMGKHFIHDSLPPVTTDEEKRCSVHGHGERWDAKTMSVRGTVELEPDTSVKLIRKAVLRLVTEEDAVHVYHSLENARVYHEKDPQFIEISAQAAPAIEHLIHSYPEFVPVDSLPQPTVEERVEIASILYDKGLLITSEPLESPDDDDSSVASANN